MDSIVICFVFFSGARRRKCQSFLPVFGVVVVVCSSFLFFVVVVVVIRRRGFVEWKTNEKKTKKKTREKNRYLSVRPKRSAPIGRGAVVVVVVGHIPRSFLDAGHWRSGRRRRCRSVGRFRWPTTEFQALERLGFIDAALPSLRTTTTTTTTTTTATATVDDRSNVWPFGFLRTIASCRWQSIKRRKRNDN